VFDPASDIDFYESLEGMLVQVNNAVVVGPTNDFGNSVVADNGANAGTARCSWRYPDSAGDFNPERIIIDDVIVASEPQVNVSDIQRLDYRCHRLQLWQLQALNTAPLPGVTSGGLIRQTTNLTGNANQLTVASFNVENLDPVMAPRNSVRSPTLLSTSSLRTSLLEEVQDNNGPLMTALLMQILPTRL